jgi:hypothetical protein
MDVGSPPTLLRSPWLYLTSLFRPWTAREKQGVQRTKWFDDESFGYNLLQSTRPQTIGYSLADSPVGLLAWIYEKLHEWSDAYSWTDEEIITWVSIYWFSKAGPAACGRIYYEMNRSDPATYGMRMTRDQLREYRRNGVKIGYSHFPKDIHVLPSSWVRTLGEVVFEKEHDSGGHFAAFERPMAIVADLREMFGPGGGAHGLVSPTDSKHDK